MVLGREQASSPSRPGTGGERHRHPGHAIRHVRTLTSSRTTDVGRRGPSVARRGRGAVGLVGFGSEATAAGGKRRWCLVLAGWTEYPYPESMYAATRAGVPLSPAVPERLAADGKTWEPVCDLGFPAGLPRVMTRALSGFTPAGKCALRIRTNMQVYWYQVYLATAEDAAGVGTVTVLEPTRADLAFRGFIQEVYPGGRPPVAYDDARTEAVATTRWKGELTGTGDVTDLLRAEDDRLVLCGPGDEITVRFDATKLPPLKPG